MTSGERPAQAERMRAMWADPVARARRCATLRGVGHIEWTTEMDCELRHLLATRPPLSIAAIAKRIGVAAGTARRKCERDGLRWRVRAPRRG